MVVDAELAQRLLSLALSRGGDYADLYFEYRAGADYVYEDEKVKTVGRGITLGLGVRVLRGEATGYAYCEELSEAAMSEAAVTAAQIAAHGQSPPPQAIEPRQIPSFYPVAMPSIDTLPEAKLALLRRADRSARAYDARIVKVQCSFAEEIKEILLVTADGRLYRDTQPLLRFGVSVVAEKDGRRQAGSGGGGGRFGMEYFDAHPPEEHAKEAARVALAMIDAQDAPAGQMEVVLAAGDSGILLHEAVGHGLEADFNRKQHQRTTRTSIGQLVASGGLHRDRRRHARSQSRALDQRRRRGAAEPRSSVLIENGKLRRLHARPPVGAAPLQARSRAGNGRRESFRHSAPMPRMTNTIPHGGAPSDPEEILEDSVKKGIFARRSSAAVRSNISQRRLRVLADGGVPDRGRQGHGAAQGGQPHRQRAGGADAGEHAGQRLPAVGRHLDLRQGRPVGARGGGDAHREDLRHHRGRDQGVTAKARR